MGGLGVATEEAWRARRLLLVAAAVLFLVVGVGLAVIRITAQPAGTGEEIVVRVSGDQFPVSVGGEQITSTNALLKDSSSESTVKHECGENIKGASLVDGRLTRDVVVVKSSNVGVVCIGQGTTQTVGHVAVTARNVSQIVSEVRDNKSYAYKDPVDGKTIFFRELGIRSISSYRENLVNQIAVVLIALGAGLSVELLVRR
jgi:hypothetical protein